MKQKNFRFHVIHAICLTLALTLTACETTHIARPTAEPSVSATEAEARGDYVVAAHEYLRQATTLQPPQKQSTQLRAVEMLVKAGQPQEAHSVLLGIDIQGLDASFDARKHILEAKSFSLEGAHEKAIRELDDAARTHNLDPALLAEIYLTRSQAELALNNPVGAVRNLISREALIVDKDVVADNQMQIWKTLNAIPRAQLQSARQLTGDPLLGGWLDLALVAADNTGNKSLLEQALTKWRTQYPTHPASRSLIDVVVRPAPEMIGRIERIALLLPLSSPYARAAQAVRDGFSAASTANTAADKPSVKIYDIGSDPVRAPEFYQMAVKDGAQVIVGPLGRESVDSVIHGKVVSVPTLLLSHTDDESSADVRYLFQFGLPPEQEARQVAERAYLDGHRNATVLFPENPWGERMQSEFVATWQRLGGIVVAAQPYREGDTDHSEAIKQLANINQSLERAQRIETTVHTKLAFEIKNTRPRQDIDFVFLVANANSGRLIKPQLNFYQIGRVPVYSTSNIYTGKADPLHDRDLDGVIFGDMPWMLQTDGKVQQLRRAQGNWPGAYSDLDRLYALGVDSYSVLPLLNRIGTDTGTRFSGVTSTLSLDRTGRVQRSLTWARFHNGVPKLIDTSHPLPSQLDVEPVAED